MCNKTLSFPQPWEAQCEIKLYRSPDPGRLTCNKALSFPRLREAHREIKLYRSPDPGRLNVK